MARLVLFDRVWETSTTIGTGTFTLAGAKVGYQSFSVVGDSNTVPYTITDGTNWEVGEGTYTSSGTTLSRDRIFASSNSGNAVNFGAGTKDVMLTENSNLIKQINVEDTFVSTELISGVKAVTFNTSGYTQIAMAGVANRMPAVGVAIDNTVSGANTRIYTRGRITSPQWNFSGYIDNIVYVGQSGDLVVSGLSHLSGNTNQPLGVVTSHSGILLQSINIITSGIASGSIGQNELSLNAVRSGAIASGSIDWYVFASGASIDRSLCVSPFLSGISNISTITEETISGCRAVCLSQSGNLRIAMSSVSGRMPAIGMIIDNVASGIQANVRAFGATQFTSGMADFSGYLGKLIYVGRSGQIVTTSGSFNSGGLLSGDITQPIGMIVNSGGVYFSVAAMLPFVTSLVNSGNIGSGQIGTNHLSSGAIGTYSRNVIEDSFVAGEAISGLKPVCIISGGTLAVAQGASGLRMPAIGVANSNVQSGGTVNVVMMGKLMLTSGLDAAFSGQQGRLLFASTSGHLITSTHPTTGIAQRIGIAVSGGILVRPENIFQSGQRSIQSGTA